MSRSLSTTVKTERKLELMTKTSKCRMCKTLNTNTLVTLTLTVIYKIEKRLFIYRRQVHNSDQNDFDLLADHTQAKIIIISAISKCFFGRQGDAGVQPAKRSLKQPFCCGNISFSHLFLSNCEGLTCLIHKIVQSNQIVI